MSAADRLAGIKGHEVKPYGQTSYEGDFCRQCGWQGPPHTGQNHNLETRIAAIEAALLVHDARVKAEALREAAAKWQTGAWAENMPHGASRPALILGMAQHATEWLRGRADEIEATR